jgi:hypothetical protein
VRIFSNICVNVEKKFECLNIWKEISSRNKKSGRLCDVRYNNLHTFCDDSEKFDNVCCVKRKSYSLNTRIFSDFHAIIRKFKISEK